MNYKTALEMIATGQITGELNNYKDMVCVMKQIATQALSTPQIQELSDEEIKELGNEVWRQDPLLFDWMYFARAILRKAQENG